LRGRFLNRRGIPNLITLSDVGFVLLGGVGGGMLAWDHPMVTTRAAGVAATILGGTIAAVVASLAVLVSLLNDVVIVRMKELGHHPFDFMGPLVVTAALGVVASVAVLIVGAMPASVPRWVRVPMSAAAGGCTLAAVVSLIPDLIVLNRLIDFRARSSMLGKNALTDREADYEGRGGEGGA
jgi:hypothetical protein